MKTLLLPFAFVTSSALAQWSTDPAAPLQVCGTAGAPSAPSVFSDGSGGWFAFWTDKRTDQTNREIYGQHLDPDGMALWPNDGKLIHNEPGSSIEEIAAARLDNGNVMIAYLFRPAVFQDTLRALAIDANGDPVWSAPTHITQCGSPILGLGDLRVMSTAGGAYVAWYDTYFGGSNGINVTRVTSAGDLPWGVDGYAIPSAAYGPYELLNDHATGAVVQWRTGNGSGAHLMAMRVDSTGANVWAANVQTSVGSGGLNYAFHSTVDGLGAHLTAFVDLPHHIVMARVDTTGALTYSPSPVSVCTFASDQDQPMVVVSEGYTFVAWTDNRPPANYRDLYLQKLDADGLPQWDPDGVAAIQLNTYIPTPGLVLSDSGAVIATIDANVAGYSAMRMRADGTAAWPAPVQFCTPAFNPFYTSQTQHADGEGGVVSFWLSSGIAIHAARIHRNGSLNNDVGIDEHASSTSIAAYPNPANDLITFTLPANERATRIELINMTGAIVAHHSRTGTINIHALHAGSYTARIRTAHGVYFSRFIKL
ncbi:MAG: T9SS type A sorting domain-containing protein [Flavobacteriales bacterium]